MTHAPSESPPAQAAAIVDNRSRRVGDFLRTWIDPGARLSIVSAYFTIYAYEALRDVLDAAGRVRFLYGEPRGVGSMDPSADNAKVFRLTEEGGLELTRVLAQKALARACAAWIEARVDVRTIAQANFLHGKLYHVARLAGDSVALVGSSNLTRRGLGLGAAPNVELNLEVRNDEDRAPLLRWFDDLWNDDRLTRDAKAEVLAALRRLGMDYAPEFIYYKTLFHVFEDRLAERGDREGLLDGVHLHDTQIWNALYEFQRDGATSVINRLLRHNGCIIADSVGLGKTWTALAVIKFFELRNERVLVLCPKKLKKNWIRYTSRAADRNNPFEADRLGYTVLAHTDLSRYEGESGEIDLARFNWGAFDLIVIDESHNFRNEGRDRTDEAGNVLRRSRYNRLLEEVIRAGVRTSVLMLSATPVNTSLRDLRNQIYLMTEKRRETFRQTLGIGDIQTLFGVAQRQFQQWEQQRARRRRSGGQTDKDALLRSLGADFLALLDAVTIARSRDHVRRFYPQVEARIGGFPKRAKPQNLYPSTDREGELSYDDLHERIGDFRLAVYMPSQYLTDRSELEAEKAKYRFDQSDREHWLIGMIRVNLLKRLESSVHSFALTMARILEKMNELDSRIDAWLQGGGSGQIRMFPDSDEEDDEFTLGTGGRRYRLAALDLDRWRQDLREDRRIFEELHRRAQLVTAERDAKLAELKGALQRKVRHPTSDKDGRPNRKALVFTTFADTADYLYAHLEGWARESLGVHVALVTGGDGNRTTLGAADFSEILGRFAPRAQQDAGSGDEIDILIATDCLSEGQDLQDCDLVVNYDIHWNPVRLMQRFGRIDRIGSRNEQVAMINFWPTAELDRYLDLKVRVEARMALADAAATGVDDPLAVSTKDLTESEQAIRLSLSFRDEQLKRLREEILDVEATDDGIAMSDFTLDDFIADLLTYIQQNRAALEAAPFGVHAVAEPRADLLEAQAIRPGAVFCLRQRQKSGARTPNPLQPYFLAYVRNDGTVRYTFKQAKQVLTLFRAVAAGRSEALTPLVDAFDRETGHGQDMATYDALLAAALRSIIGTFRATEQQRLGFDRGARLTRTSERPNRALDFELIAWLAIMDRNHADDADGTGRQSNA